MPHLFTVRWPVFARMEVILFFPFALRLASETELVRTDVDKAIMPALAPVCVTLGFSNNAIFWLAMTAVVAVPYLVTTIVADRLMTVRKGYALLSLLAIAIWSLALARLSWLLIGMVPESALAGTKWLSFDQEVALAAAGVALVLHLRPLWIGLRDDGEVAIRLLDAGYDSTWRSGSAGQGRHAEDLYHRQTAGFREWRYPQQEFEGLGSGPREHSAVKALHVITWLGVIVGIGAFYINWAGLIDLRHQGFRIAAAPGVAAGPLTGGAALKPVTLPPVVQVTPAMPMVNSHVVVAPPMPMVQRPTETSSSVQSPTAIGGANEAVSERGADGSFAFDAVVNGGVHVRMLFDTGASVVGLRAEDATRIGIPIGNLTYSAKIKTANGTADVAPVMIGTMMIGNITLRNVPGFVAKQGMLQENLLGQTFLERLAGFNVEKNLLVLKGR